MANKVKFKKALEKNVPTLVNDDFTLIFTENGNLYTDTGTLKSKVTDVVFVNSLPSIGKTNKIYVLSTDYSINIYDTTWHKSKADIVDDLVHTNTDIGLSANQGKVLKDLVDALTTVINNHKSDVNNPHQITKAQVGLGNVDNTSDVNKPISTATQIALDKKLNFAGLDGSINKNLLDLPNGNYYIENAMETNGYPSGVKYAYMTKNYMDFFLTDRSTGKMYHKYINGGGSWVDWQEMTPTKAYVDNGLNSAYNSISTINTSLGNKVDKVTGKSLISDTEITRLAGVANYTHPTTHDVSIITGLAPVSKTGRYTDLVGLPNIPTVDVTKLYVDTEVAKKANTSHTHAISDTTNLQTALDGKASTTTATTTANGLMSKEDKSKLDGVATGANNYAHPSTHPASVIVQDADNRFCTDTEKTSWNSRSFQGHKHMKAEIIDFPVVSPINDATKSTTSLYSSDKIENLLATKAGLTVASSASNGLMAVKEFNKLSNIMEMANRTIPSEINGNIVIGSTEIKVYTHPTGSTATNPHGTTKDDVGLGNVDNTRDINKPISTPVKFALDEKAYYIHTHTKSEITDLQTALDAKEDTSKKGVANGYAGLDSTGKVPSSQLPSYVDDVLEYANKASFPATGEAGKIYIALDNNVGYRWSGSTYIAITSSEVTSVNSKTGAVVLTATDVGLGNVNNTADKDKPISTAVQTALDTKASFISGSTTSYKTTYSSQEVKDTFMSGKPTVLDSSYILDTFAGTGVYTSTCAKTGMGYPITTSELMYLFCDIYRQTAFVCNNRRYTTYTRNRLSNQSWSAWVQDDCFEKSSTNGNLKINGVETPIYTHPSTHPASSITGLASVATSGSYSSLSGTPNLSTVATTGNYNDLSNKPSLATSSVAGLMSSTDKNRFDLMTNNCNFVEDGYVTLPNGLIMQWGTVSVTSSTQTLAVLFNIPFNSVCLNVQATVKWNSASGSGVDAVYVQAIDKTSFALTHDYTGTCVSWDHYWFAIGY